MAGAAHPEKNRKPRIAIVGAGAIGSLVGGLLANRGEDVLLVGTAAHMTAIRRHGLKIDGIEGVFTTWPSVAGQLAEKPDIIVLAVKSQDVTSACRAIQPWVGHIPVVMIQNGMSSAEAAAALLDRRQIVSAVFMLNAGFLEPGRVSYVKPGPVVVGHAFVPNNADTDRVCSLLAKGFKVTISDNIQGVQWTKLLVNALGNALDGLTGMAMGEYQHYPVLWRIGTMILKEARALIDRAGISMAPLPGIPMGGLKLMLRMPLPVAARLLKQVTLAKGDGQIRTSTLQSLLKGKPSEIDYLHGEFVRLGTKLGIAAPVNAKVVELIHRIEKTHRFFTPDELGRAFGVTRHGKERWDNG